MISSGGWSRWLLASMVAVVATVVWADCLAGVDLSLFFFPDTYDYAQMGRQVYRGEGFTSLQTFPYVLRFLADHGVSLEPPWPNTTRFPLISVLHAVTFSLVGPSDFGIALTGGALLVACSILVFLLGERLFGPLAGLVAAILVCTDKTQLSYSVSGLLETGAAAFLVATCLVLSIVLDDPRRRGAQLALGICLGLAFLQRYDLLALAPPVVVILLLAPATRSASTLAMVAIGFLIPTAPWFARNLTHFGSLLGSTSIDRNILGGVIEGDVYSSSGSVNVWAELLRNYRNVLWKFVKSFTWIRANATTLFGESFFWLGPAFLLSRLALRSPTARLVWLFIALSFVSRFSLLSLMHHEARFYSSFMPALLVLAVGGVVVLLRALPGVLGHPLLRVAGASAVVAFALGPKLSTLEFRANGLGALPAPFDAVAELTPPRSVVAARGPRVAWYGDRPTLRLSGDLSSLETVDEELVRIDAVLLPDEARAFHADLASRPDLGFRVAAQAERQTLWVKQVEELRP